MKPYFADDHVELYHGDMRELLPTLDVRADACITDPPYGETSHPWDRWPDGWVKALGDVTNSLWCFGSMKMYHEAQREPATFDAKGRTRGRSVVGNRKHTGAIGEKVYEDDGTRLVRSVIRTKSVRRGIHRTEKPQEILRLMIEYSVPPGGLVIDPFAGSGSTLLTARSLGRRAIGIEADEACCETAANRLSEPDLFATPA